MPGQQSSSGGMGGEEPLKSHFYFGLRSRARAEGGAWGSRRGDVPPTQAHAAPSRAPGKSSCAFSFRSNIERAILFSRLPRRRSRDAELPEAVEEVHPAHEARPQGVPSREDVQGAGAERRAAEEGHGGRHFRPSPLLAEDGEGSGGGGGGAMVENKKNERRNRAKMEEARGAHANLRTRRV